MKRIYLIAGIIIGASMTLGTIAEAAFAPISIPAGGTATTTAPSGQLIYGGSTAYQSVATTTVTCSGSASCTGFVAIGTSPITITASGGGTGLATSSPISAGNLLEYTATGSGSAFGVATTSVGCSGNISCTGFTALGSASTISFTGTLAIGSGGTGTTTAASSQLLYGGGAGVYQSVATSSFTPNADFSTTGTVGAFVGGAASTLALNMATAHSWTGLQSFANASSSLFSAGKAWFGLTATTTIDGTGNIVVPSGSNLTVTGKTDGCATWATGVLNSTGVACGSGGGSFPFSADNTYGQVVYSTSTPTLWFKSGLYASSTSYLVNASTTAITATRSISVGSDNFGAGAGTLIAGESNTVDDTDSAAFGTQNSILGGSGVGNFANGRNNQITNNSTYTIVSGNSNLADQVTDANIFGNANEIHVGASDSVIMGNNNIIKDNAYDNFLLGDSNTAYGTGAELIGFNNFSSSTVANAQVFGTYLNIVGNDSVLLGTGVNASNMLTLSAAKTVALGAFSTVPSITLMPGRIGNIGNVGIASTSPYALLSVHALGTGTNAGATTTLFAIGSSTAAFATSTLFSVGNTGNIFTTLSNGCVQAASGILTSTGSACGSGGGIGDPFTHPAAGQSATTSLMLFNGQASTTQLSAGLAYFGLTATSSFSGTGALTLATALTVANGGTGATTQSTNGVNYYNGTSITSNNGQLYWDGTRFGIASSTPNAMLSIHHKDGATFTNIFTIASSTATATTTLFNVNNNGQTAITTPTSIATAFGVSTSTVGNPIFGVDTTNSAGNIFSIATTTGTIFWGIDRVGHIFATTSTPTLSSCGTSPSMTGGDSRGTITTGATASGCTVTFGTAYSNVPSCTVSPQTGSVVNTFSYTVSASAITVTETGLGGGKFDYICMGN